MQGSAVNGSIMLYVKPEEGITALSSHSLPKVGEYCGAPLLYVIHLLMRVL